MQSFSYLERRGQLETYFDRTAVDAWSRLTSDAPVSRIRATVRAGRDEMRRTLLAWLPADLRGRRLLDAGCGTGALAVEAARRGARVVAIDLSPTLIDLARARTPRDLGAGSVEFLSATCSIRRSAGLITWSRWIRSSITAPAMRFRRVAGLAQRTPQDFAVHLCTANAGACCDACGRPFVPRAVVRPRSSRSPKTRSGVGSSRSRAWATWRAARTGRIASGFYMSQALELTAQ